MMRLAIILSTMLLATGAAMAVDHSPFAVSGETSTWLSDVSLSVGDRRYWEPNTMIGFRFHVDRAHSLDLRFGLEKVSEVERDEATGTDPEPAYSCLSLEGGFMIKSMEAEKSYVGILGRFRTTFHKLSMYIFDPDAPWEDYKFEAYNLTTISFFLGAEPTYFFNNHFSLYSTFGIRLKLIPSTKYVEYPDDWDHDAYVAGDYKLVKRRDSRSVIASDGIWIGVRYYP